jgi:osmoprotectant transport system substrate-binding protein
MTAPVRRALALAAVALAAIALAACGGGGGSTGTTGTSAARSDLPPLRVGTKNFPEQLILGELYRQALEAKGFRVEVKPNIGSTEIIHQALSDGALDMYPEYIGVLLSEVAGERTRPRSPQAAYGQAQAFEERRGFTLLGMTPFSDANALAVKPAYARRNGVRSIGDLADVPGTVRIGAPPEFRTRFEGLVGLAQRYGIRNAEATPLQIGSQYGALDSGRVDAAAVFTTDGQLAGRGYVLLRDPEGVFGTQHVAPIISRRALAARGPRLRAAVDAVSRRLTAAAMRRMNAAVVLRGRDPGAVAGEFLEQEGLT